MPGDVYALSLEMTLNDLVSESISKISDNIDAVIAKTKEFEAAINTASTNAVVKLNEHIAKLNEVGAATVAAQQKTQSGSEQLLNMQNEQFNNAKIEKTLFDAQSKKEKAFANDEIKNNKILGEQQKKLNAGEMLTKKLFDATSSAFGKLKNLTKGIAEGFASVLSSGNEATKATEEMSAAAGGAGDNINKAGGATGGFDDNINDMVDSLFKFINMATIAYGTVLTMFLSQLEVAARRAEEFSTSIYRVNGSMYEMGQGVSIASFNVKALSDDVAAMAKSLAEAGAQGSELFALVETSSLFNKSMGASAEVTAQFANRMRIVLGTARDAEVQMALLYEATKEFGLSGQDANAIMVEATKSATTIGTYGAKAVKEYTETLILASAAAKKLGVNTQEAIQLISSMKEPLSGVKILGGEVLKLDPAGKMKAIMKEIPRIGKEYEEMVKNSGAGYATLVLQARYDLDPTQLKLIQKMAEEQEIMIKTGLSTEQVSKDLENIKNAAQEATTGLFSEGQKVYDNLMSISIMIFSPLLPLFKMLFVVVNGVLSIIGAFLAPIAQLFMKIADILDISVELNGTFTLLRNIANAVGKVLAFIVFSVLGPFLATLAIIIGALKLIYAAVQPALAVIIDIVSWFGEGMFEAVMIVFDAFKQIINALTWIVTFGGSFTALWQSLGPIIKPIVKLIGGIAAAILFLALVTKAYSVATAIWAALSILWAEGLSMSLLRLGLATDAANMPLLTRAFSWMMGTYDAAKSIVLQLLGFKAMTFEGAIANQPLATRVLYYARQTIAAIKNTAVEIWGFITKKAAADAANVPLYTRMWLWIKTAGQAAISAALEIAALFGVQAAGASTNATLTSGFIVSTGAAVGLSSATSLLLAKFLIFAAIGYVMYKLWTDFGVAGKMLAVVLGIMAIALMAWNAGLILTKVLLDVLGIGLIITLVVLLVYGFVWLTNKLGILGTVLKIVGIIALAVFAPILIPIYLIYKGIAWLTEKLGGFGNVLKIVGIIALAVLAPILIPIYLIYKGIAWLISKISSLGQVLKIVGIIALAVLAPILIPIYLIYKGIAWLIEKLGSLGKVLKIVGIIALVALAPILIPIYLIYKGISWLIEKLGSLGKVLKIVGMIALAVLAPILLPIYLIYKGVSWLIEKLGSLGKIFGVVFGFIGSVFGWIWGKITSLG